MASPVLIPSRTPVSAPANQIVRFTRAPSPSSGGVAAPPRGVAPPPGVVPPPQGAPSLSAPSVPQSAPPVAPPNAVGTPAVPAAIAAPAVGGGVGLVPVLAGVGGFLLGDLIFPQPVGNAEAPGIDPAISPSQTAPPTYPPITLPPGGIQATGTYRVTVNFNVFNKSLQQDFPGTANTQSSGANIPATLTQQRTTYVYDNAFNIGTIVSQSIELLIPGSPPSTFPDYTPFQPIIGRGQPLQDAVPVDTQGNRRAFVPPPAPVIVPFRRPVPAPTAPPVPVAPPERSPVPVPPVIPQTPPDAPPFAPPTPYTPLSPVPGSPSTPSRTPSVPPVPLPPFVPVRPPLAPGRPVLDPPPVKVPPTQRPPVDGSGTYLTPETPPAAPPSVPPTGRTRPGDCCDPPDGGKAEDCCEEILQKLRELHECACPDDRELTTTSLGSGDSITAELPLDTIRVSCQVTEPNARVRIQSGNPDGQPVYFLGWYAFGRDGKWDDRKPISHLYSEFLCPPRANMMTLTLVFDTVGTFVATHLIPLSP